MEWVIRYRLVIASVKPADLTKNLRALSELNENDLKVTYSLM